MEVVGKGNRVRSGGRGVEWWEVAGEGSGGGWGEEWREVAGRGIE